MFSLLRITTTIMVRLFELSFCMLSPIEFSRAGEGTKFVAVTRRTERHTHPLTRHYGNDITRTN